MSKFNKLVDGAMKEMNRTMPNKMPMSKIAINPEITTTSKKNKAGEIINPTKKDVSEYNKKYQTIKKNKAPAIPQREQMRRTLENNRKKGKYSSGIGVGK